MNEAVYIIVAVCHSLAAYNVLSIQNTLYFLYINLHQ